ncbi:c-type cytochrome domain-containing protein [Blastopirellula retiformator]|uniref:WD domain, G-beta repeat n=1 Tax=Blastopirellula retiformator TaxID=2527970 RepID=A0A5C5VAD3_9BACT|nr:c-type cytochrome domain-containing protein [Blastopirellula retiformator]TWT34672.1 WD domain, G-beta repeat [Blastopirellula retiformator]
MRSLLSVSLVSLLSAAASAVAEEAPVSFRRDVAPILLDRCQACHGAKKAEGGYRVDTFVQLQKAGDSGEPPIGASAAEPSELLRRITCTDEFERMPVDSDPLSAAQIALFTKWIAAGAKFDGADPAQPLRLVIPPPTYAAAPASYPRAVPITAVTFSPDGKQLVVGGYHELTIWDVASGKLARRIGNLGERTYALRFSPDGQMLAVGCGQPGASGEVRLVRFASGGVTGVVCRSDDVVLDLAFRPGSTQLAAAMTDSSIRVVDTASLSEVRTIAGHADWVTAIAYSDDGTQLASASLDQSAKVFDAETGAVLASYPGHAAAVRGVCILPDNQQVVSVGDDQKVHRWQIADAKKVAEIGIGAEGRALLRTGDDLFVPAADKRTRRIDLKENKVAQQFEGHGDWVLSAAIFGAKQEAGDARVLATGDFAGEVRLWKLADGSLQQSWLAKP